MTKTLEDSKKQNTLIKGSLLPPRRLGRQALSPGRTKARSLQPGEPKPRVARKVPKVARKVPVARMPKPTRTPVTPRRRRSPVLRRRKKSNHVSLFLIILHLVVPPFLIV